MKKSILLSVILFVSITTLFNSCDWEEEITVSGIVINTDNFPLSGVSIKAGDRTILTSETGAFLFEGLKSEGDFVKKKRTGLLKDIKKNKIIIIKGGGDEVYRIIGKK